MKVLMISSDRNIVVSGSTVAERMKEYGNLVEELHIVILSDSAHGLKTAQLSQNVWVYPTNSLFSLIRPIDAARLGKRIVLEKKFARGQSLITAQDPFESGWAALKVKRKWRLPLEIQVHTDPFSPYFGGFQNIVRKSFAGEVLANAESIRVVSQELKNKITPLTKATINILPIYIDKERIEAEHLSFDVHTRYPWHFIILTVGRLTPEKNLPLTLKILSMVREKFPDTGLIIVGSGPEEGRLRELVKKMKLESAVAFVGWQNELASFYRTSNVFVQTSFFEGYGLALVEAGLSGIPVITSPVGIAVELEHGKDAYIYPVDRPDLFAAGIIDLLENNFKRENLKINLKRTLDSKLLSKEEYLKRLGESWQKSSSMIK